MTIFGVGIGSRGRDLHSHSSWRVKGIGGGRCLPTELGVIVEYVWFVVVVGVGVVVVD